MLAGLLSLALLLGGCGQGSGGSASSSGTPTLVTGEASSQDGRFRVEAGETLRIVAADSGETVWEEDSYPWQAVSWSAGDPVLAVLSYGDETEKFLTAGAWLSGGRHPPQHGGRRPAHPRQPRCGVLGRLQHLLE